jgi:hypothetical protein
MIRIRVLRATSTSPPAFLTKGWFPSLVDISVVALNLFASQLPTASASNTTWIARLRTHISLPLAPPDYTISAL